MKKLRLAFKFLLVLFVILLIVIVVNTFAFSTKQIEVETVAFPLSGEAAVAHLSEAITFQTISYSTDAPVDTIAFSGFHDFLSRSYPLIHSKLKKETFSGFSILYKWEGSKPGLKPVVLLAHQDVVPAGESDKWSKPPFSGENDGTFIWGRGTLDDKGSLISIMEGVEKLLSENYQPARTIYLAFGHDEELTKPEGGAGVMAAVLKQRGEEADYIIDEGYAVTVGIVPMVSKPVALIGTSEKGYLSVILTVEMAGGHTAYPEKETSITVLTRAINKIVDNQMEAVISEPVNDFITYIGPEMPFYAKAIFANKWLFKGVILKIYQGSKTSNALVRTTTAPTIINSGIKDNVIPTKAEAVVNFRILPGETSDDVMEHLRTTILDERVKISKIAGYKEPAPVSPKEVFGFNTILKTIKQVFPEALIAPTMTTVASDARKYIGVSKNIYNFAPIIVTSEDMARMHGLDERIRIEDFKSAIAFYYQLIQNSGMEPELK